MKPKQKEFIKEYIQNGNNATKAAKNVYKIKDENYAGLKGHRMIRNDKIQNAIKSIADKIPDELLEKVHLEGLTAGRQVGEVLEADYAVRHKYLDTAYKLKGSFAPEKTESKVTIETISQEEKEALLKLLK